jgi:opine dehydrogenase
MVNRTSNKLSFAIIGGGHGGHGFAAYLSHLGHQVNLYNRTIEHVENIKTQGYIEMVGSISGRGYINLVTDNIEEAIQDVDIIMIVVPASAHKNIANLLAPYVTEEQFIVLNPGRTGGALEFLNIIRKKNHAMQVCIVEAQTMLFACRIVSEGVVKMLSKKKEVKIAALPATQTIAFLKLITPIIPEFIEASSVLDTSFNNVGALLHPIPTILNCGRIESTNGDFLFYIDGITPTVAKIIENVDHERMQIAHMLGIEALSLKNWLKHAYGARGKTITEALSNVACYLEIKAPTSMDTRYIFEDIPQSLVPIAGMGKKLGIETPTIDALIQLASVMHNKDYAVLGRSIEDMGLENMTLTEMKQFVVDCKVV